MKKRPTLSIIIPTWNTSETTQKCVFTLKKYLPSNYAQIIVVDNGSTDTTESDFLKIKNITYIRNSSNLGFAKGNNIGAKKALGEFLLFLNSDMELIDNSLINMVDFLKNSSYIAAIGPKFLNPDLTPQGSVLHSQTIFSAIKEFWFMIPNSYIKYSPKSEQPLPVDNISGGAILIKTSFFKKIGGWDERYFFYYEDLEICRQIHRLHKLIYYYPGCKIIHRHGASGHKIADQNNQWRRLVPSSIIYHGYLKHTLLTIIIWIPQKIKVFFNFFLRYKRSVSH